MGVFIYPCKIKEKVSDTTDNDVFDTLMGKYDKMGEEIVTIKEMNEYNDFTQPFEKGIYTYESGNSSLDMSYGTNWDFLMTLQCIREDVDDINAFDTILSASSIEGCIGYETAQEMLDEFEQYKDQAEHHFKNWGGSDEYGALMWSIYQRYIEVLKECVEIKGIVHYT